MPTALPATSRSVHLATAPTAAAPTPTPAGRPRRARRTQWSAGTRARFERHWFRGRTDVPCPCCGRAWITCLEPGGYVLAHVVASARGGSDSDPLNRVPACASCNFEAGTRRPVCQLDAVAAHHPHRVGALCAHLRRAARAWSAPSAATDGHAAASAGAASTTASSSTTTTTLAEWVRRMYGERPGGVQSERVYLLCDQWEHRHRERRAHRHALERIASEADALYAHLARLSRDRREHQAALERLGSHDDSYSRAAAGGTPSPRRPPIVLDLTGGGDRDRASSSIDDTRARAHLYRRVPTDVVRWWLRTWAPREMALPLRCVCRRFARHVRSADVVQSRQLLCTYAARHNALALLRWAHLEAGCPVEVRTFEAAVEHGSRRMLRWLYDTRERPAWLPAQLMLEPWWRASVWLCAARRGSVRILRWLRRRETLPRLEPQQQQQPPPPSGEHGAGAPQEWLVAGVAAGGASSDGGLDAPVRCDLGRTCAVAAEHGHLRALRWLVAERFPVDAQALVRAIRLGHRRVVRWLLGRHRPPSSTSAPLRIVPTESVCVAALRMREFGLLRRLWRRGAPLTATTASVAAWWGDRHVLEWMADVARQQPAHWDSACTDAIEGGHAALVPWLVERGAPVQTRTLAALAERGDTDTLGWLLEHRADTIVSLLHPDVLEAAAEGGQWWLLEWLHARAPHLRLTAAVSNWCVYWQQLAWLQWAYARGAPLTEWTAAEAAIHGNLEMLEWMWAHAQARTGPLLDAWVMAQAAGHGQAHVVQWMREHAHVPWDDRVTLKAAIHGQVALLAWLVEHGCPLDGAAAMGFAIRASQLDVVRWLHEHARVPLPEALSAIDYAFETIHSDLLQWLHDRGCRATFRPRAPAASASDDDGAGWDALDL